MTHPTPTNGGGERQATCDACKQRDATYATGVFAGRQTYLCDECRTEVAEKRIHRRALKMGSNILETLKADIRETMKRREALRAECRELEQRSARARERLHRDVTARYGLRQEAALARGTGGEG